MSMFVNQIRGRNLQNVDGTSTDRIDNPDWAVIERAIRALGKNALALELRHLPFAEEPEPTQASRPSFMGITGGARGAYSIFVHDSSGSVYHLSIRSDKPVPSDEESLDEIPSPTLSVAIQVAQTYVSNGKLDEKFFWWKAPPQ